MKLLKVTEWYIQIAYYDEKNLTKAKKLFQEALSKSHKLFGVRKDLDVIAIDEGDLKTAIMMFENELNFAKRPNRDTAILYLYAIYTVIGDVKKAHSISKEFYEVARRIFLDPKEINKINNAAMRTFWSNWYNK